jgi:hypothetical protein
MRRWWVGFGVGIVVGACAVIAAAEAARWSQARAERGFARRLMPVLKEYVERGGR